MVLGAATLLSGLVLMLPARVVYEWFAPPNIKLADISGTVWRGNAARAEINGFYLSGLEWRGKPLALVKGQAAYGIDTSLAAGDLKGDVGISVGGTILLHDISASIPLQALEIPTGLRGLRGDLTINAERIVVENGIPTAVNGEAEVSGLVVPLIHNASIGGYRLEFFTQDNGVMASVEDTDGVVDLAGSLEVFPDRNYRFIGLVAPKSNTPPQLRQQLEFLGTPNDRGQREIRLEGIF